MKPRPPCAEKRSQQPKGLGEKRLRATKARAKSQKEGSHGNGAVVLESTLCAATPITALELDAIARLVGNDLVKLLAESER